MLSVFGTHLDLHNDCSLRLDSLIYHSAGPAEACRFLYKAQSCGSLGKGPGFLRTGSRVSQAECDTE